MQLIRKELEVTFVPKTNLPSMQVRSCETILRSISLDAVSLLGVMESISSRNNTHGAWVWKDEHVKSFVGPATVFLLFLSETS